jgi:hypothetical protein
MKILTVLFRPFRVFIPHSPLVTWRSLMPENRLGMIVCGAFLGLVSAVVVAKVREPAAKPDPAVAAASADDLASKNDPPPTPPAPTPEEAPTLPPPIPHTEPISLPEPSVPATPHPAAAPPKKLTPEPPASGFALKDLPAPPNGFTPAAATEPSQNGPPAPPAPPEHDASPASAGLKLEPPPAPPVPEPPSPPSPPPLGETEKKDKGNSKANDQSKDNKDIKNQEREKKDKDAAPTLLPQNNGSSEPPALPGPPPFPTPPPEPKDNDPAKVPVKITPPPEPMPIRADPPLTAPEPPASKQDKVTVVIPASPAPSRVEPPPFVPSSAPRPIAATPPSGGPLVDSWDERTYVAKTGDSYAAISLSEYKTEDYAKALQMYNQNHPRAGDAMRRDGTMAPGDRIYLPPSPVLEKRHADVIVRSKPKPVTAGSFGDEGLGPVQAEFRAPAERPATPDYKVRGKDETLFSIAAQQLGNGNRWGEIAALNPKAPTDRALLGGTLLRMPAASANAAPPVPHP